MYNCNLYIAISQFTGKEKLYSTNLHLGVIGLYFISFNLFHTYKTPCNAKRHYREFYYVKNYSTLCFVTEFLIVTKQLLYVDYFWA